MKRRNLLLSPVGKKSLEICQGWASGDRTYDIMLLYFDSEGSENFLQIAEHIVKTKGFKYPLIHQFFSDNIELISNYEYFFFPDDDIRMTSRDINKLFYFAKKKRISVCQPSLYPKNFYWEITQNNPDTKYRYVSLVEIMCPLFSREALTKCLSSFLESNSGWGLEIAWYRLLGSKKKQFIIYDLVIALHEGILGASSKLYDNLTEMGISPDEEFNRLEAKYNMQTEFYNIEYVYKFEYLWNSFLKKIKSLIFIGRD